MAIWAFAKAAQELEKLPYQGEPYKDRIEGKGMAEYLVEAMSIAGRERTKHFLVSQLNEQSACELARTHSTGRGCVDFKVRGTYKTRRKNAGVWRVWLAGKVIFPANLRER